MWLVICDFRYTTWFAIPIFSKWITGLNKILEFTRFEKSAIWQWINGTVTTTPFQTLYVIVCQKGARYQACQVAIIHTDTSDTCSQMASVLLW